jgi:hypothetical protein
VTGHLVDHRDQVDGARVGAAVVDRQYLGTASAGIVAATSARVARRTLPVADSLDSALVLVAPLRHVREHDVAISEALRIGCPVVLITEMLASHFADRVDTVLVTPSMENSLPSGLVCQLLLVDALRCGRNSSKGASMCR